MMNKGFRIGINILIFAIIAGFVWYMVRGLKEDESVDMVQSIKKGTFVSPYQKGITIETAGDILRFEVYNEQIYAALSDSVVIFDLSGNRFNAFPVAEDPRDIAVDNDVIYMLYPSRIDVYSLDGQKNGGWDACSDNSDYCSFLVLSENIFVTDAENKHVCQYNTQGGFIRFINSPEGFVIPSYSFDIVSINDTIYCANSGKHKIESYTQEGKYITSFGETGAQAGAFAGCCNPVYMGVTQFGDILTSEKGNPRISCYGKDGKFRTILLDSDMLGGGNAAYEMKTLEDKLYVAGGNRIVEYTFDPASAAGSSCASCNKDCPLRKGVNQE